MINKQIVFILAFIAVMTLLSGCDSILGKNGFNEVLMGKYYNKEDFKSITIGESTFQDVYEIAPIRSINVTSYGGFCEYPMQNGGYICIKFYGKDLVVGAIEYKTEQETGDSQS